MTDVVFENFCSSCGVVLGPTGGLSCISCKHEARKVSIKCSIFGWPVFEYLPFFVLGVSDPYSVHYKEGDIIQRDTEEAGHKLSQCRHCRALIFISRNVL